MTKNKKYAFLLAIVAIFIGVFLAPAFEAQVTVLLVLISMFFALLTSMATHNALIYICIAFLSLSLPITIMEGYYFIALSKNKNHFVHDRNTAPPKEAPAAQTNTPAKKQDVPVAEAPKEAHAQKQFTYIKSKRLLNDGEILYDVTYTLNDKGHRITPTHPKATRAIVFIGCSFTFGDGLEDTQTFPWQVSEKLGADYQVFNLAISGQGTHHSLVKLQNILPQLSKYKQVAVFYTAIEDHQRRFHQGPKFIEENGFVIRQGNYSVPKFFWSGTSLEPWLKKSYLFNKVKEPLTDALSPLSNKDTRIRLLHAITATMQKGLYASYPESTFTVLAWPANTIDMFAELPKNITVLDVENWLPGFAEEEFKEGSKYILYPGVDTHPTAYANELVSNALVKRIQEQMEQ